MMMVVNHHRDDDGEYQEAFISSKLSLFLSLSLTLSNYSFYYYIC